MTGWITAYAARRIVADRREAWGSDALTNVQYAIIDYARTVLPVRCQFMWDKTLPLDRPVETVEARDTEVPSWVWDLTDDMKVDWATGIFHLSGEHDGETRYVKLVGVEFDGSAVDRIWPDAAQGAAIPILPEAPRQPETDAARSGNGGRPRSAAWNDWIAYIAVAAPDIVRQEGPDALMNKVADLMASDGLEPMPRSTVQAAAKAVIALLETKKL